ncbi:hypothetical protein ACA910_003945 [Epithemia clementina (nom. ined.)]
MTDSSWMPSAQRKERRRQDDQSHHHKFGSSNELKEFVSLLSSTSSSLRMGDLPGYTGWARPSWTTAHWYKVLFDSSAQPQVGIPYHIQIVCRVEDDDDVSHDDTNTHDKDHNQDKSATICPSFNATFYVRAYGPTILTGTVEKVNQEKDGYKLHRYYQVTLLFLEPGDYALEIVLAFSHVPSLDQFPLPTTMAEPAYEGYLLPAMPAFLTVHDHDDDDDDCNSNHKNATHPESPLSKPHPERQQRICQAPADLYESSPTSSLERETWLVQSKVSSSSSSSSLSTTTIQPAVWSLLRYNASSPSNDKNNSTIDQSNVSDNNNNNVPFVGYQQGLNSIGFRMEYHATHCRLLPLSTLVPALVKVAATAVPLQRLHMVWIGDSNMDRQRTFFSTLLNEYFPDYNYHRVLQNTMLYTNDGLYLQNPKIREGLTALFANRNDNDKFVLLFNAGLHDIDKLCTKDYGQRRQDDNLTVDHDDNDTNSDASTFSCLHRYRNDLEELIQTVLDFPFALRVFQTTTAGWLKWGVYGYQWPLTKFQIYPRDSHACQVWNEQVAWPLMTQYHISVMDAYWLSHSRPDHREIINHADANTPQRTKLVHLGVELYDVLLRKWLTLILITILPTDS